MKPKHSSMGEHKRHNRGANRELQFYSQAVGWSSKGFKNIFDNWKLFFQPLYNTLHFFVAENGPGAQLMAKYNTITEPYDGRQISPNHSWILNELFAYWPVYTQWLFGRVNSSITNSYILQMLTYK